MSMRPYGNPAVWAACLLVSVVIVPRIEIVRAQQAGAAAQIAPARQVPPLRPTAMVLPLAHAHVFGDAEIVINNNGPESQDVVPMWYVGGRRIEGEPIAVPTLQSVIRRLADLLPSGVVMANVDGLRLGYGARGVDQISAQITLLPGPGGQPSQSLDVPLAVAGDLKGTRLEAVWASPRRDERAAIALLNPTPDPVEVRVTSAGAPRQIPLAGYGTALVNLEPDQRDVGWMRLEYDAPPASLVATGYAMSATDRVPRLINFVDPAKSAQADVFATGLRAADTVTMAVKNTSDAPIGAIVRFLDPESGAPIVELPRMDLAPREARRVDVSAAAEKLAGRQRVAVQVSSTGSTGALIGDLHSDDRVSGLSFSVPLRDTGTDAGSIRRATGNCPWRLDGDYNTRFLFTNTGLTSATFVLHIAYEGGTDSMRPRELAPGASAVFDLRRMRDERLAEGFQRVIPPGIERGVMLWSIRAPSSARLAGRAEIVSVSRRVTASYTW